MRGMDYEGGDNTVGDNLFYHVDLIYAKRALTFQALALRQKETFFSDTRNVRLYYPYRQYTNLLIFRFVSEHCLRSTLRLLFLSCMYVLQSL